MRVLNGVTVLLATAGLVFSAAARAADVPASHPIGMYPDDLVNPQKAVDQFGRIPAQGVMAAETREPDGTLAAAAAQVRAVYPTGLFPDDVANVQQVVDELGQTDAKGIVILKARNQSGAPTAFNFGTSPDFFTRGMVVVDADGLGAVEFRGEIDGDDDDDGGKYAQTAIVGGLAPILSFRRAPLTVENIEFRGAALRAIGVGASTDVVIRNNTFLDTVGFADFSNPGGGVNLLTRVIFIIGLSGQDQVTGSILIEDNVIDTAIAAFSDGISITSTSAETRIRRNSISGVNVGVRYFTFSEPLHLSENTLSAHVPAANFFSAGAQVACSTGEATLARVDDNYVSVVDEFGGFAVGVDLRGFGCAITDSTVVDNDIDTANAFAGIGVFANGGTAPAGAVGNTVVDNDIRGTASTGVFLGGSVSQAGIAPEIANNLVSDNDFEDLQSGDADVFLDELTSGNFVVVDEEDTVIDLGVGNFVIDDDDDDEDEDDDDDDDDDD